VSGRTVHNLRANGVITSTDEGEDGASHSGHTGGEGDTSGTMLKLDHALFELLNGRIADTAINVTLTLLAEEISAHLSIIKDEGGSLEDGESVSMHAMLLSCTCSWSLTSVNALCILITRHYYY